MLYKRNNYKQGPQMSALELCLAASRLLQPILQLLQPAPSARTLLYCSALLQLQINTLAPQDIVSHLQAQT